MFIDTNVLIYSLDPNETEKRGKAATLLRNGILAGWIVTSPQTLNECYRVLVDRKKLMPREHARAFLATLLPTCLAPLDVTTTTEAWAIQDRTGFAWWDCVMLASAIQAECSLFASEDLTDGTEIGGLRVANPFLNDLAPRAQ